MYWLRQPPYLRWVAAGIVLCIGLFLDMRPAAVQSYPFLAADVTNGSRVDAVIEWREVPAGYLPAWDGPVTGYTVADLAAGTPLVPGTVTEAVIPEGWWSVMLPLPHPITPGTPVRVALDDTVVEGMVAGEMVDNGYEIKGPVAFPEPLAATVATAAANSALVVMIGPGSFVSGSSG